MGRTTTTPTPGHPYDNGIYQADTVYTPTLPITLTDLTPICGRYAPAGRTTTCLRQIRTSHLINDLNDITRDIASLARMRNAWRARNLIGNIEFRIRRLTFHRAQWGTDLPACTCPDDLRLDEPTRDIEATYPDCTC